jgi:hypothetical protein
VKALWELPVTLSSTTSSDTLQSCLINAAKKAANTTPVTVILLHEYGLVFRMKKGLFTLQHFVSYETLRDIKFDVTNAVLSKMEQEFLQSENDYKFAECIE